MQSIISLFLILLLAGCKTVPPPYTGPSLPVSVQTVPGFQHKVEAGQTLWRISRIYNVDIDDILKVNRISESSTIEIGQILIIPERPMSIEQAVKYAPEDFIWPLKGKIISGFGSRYRNLVNKGINILATGQADVLASRKGKVVFYASNFGNFGKTIIIDHGDGLRTVYSRMEQVFVKPGDYVQRGSMLGRAGSSQRDKNIYLHFEIRKGALPQNPLFYLP
ncbi:MAG: LysM peptidoglycan-binding domain-containing M23 family metallopeptidase [Candidatus Omnitrophica bacterium]|nr:LysM peptidoglycan-binding domain-containing M23 family metallopeptidase [Candidatus Omnitrophota bacterium]